MIAIGVVALIHVGLGYAFISGLALKAVKAVVNKVEAVNIKEKAPPPDEPPPPPPKDIEIPPYVPPPEVTVAQESQAPTITTQTTVPVPQPPVFTPPAPPAPPAPAPKADAPPTAATPKGRGNTFTDDDFPPASARAEETGVTKVTYTIGTDGRVTNCAVTASSGHQRLDDATCAIIQRRFRFNPATRDGKPVEETRPQAIRWKLSEAR